MNPSSLLPKYQIKVLQTFPFQCGVTHCPKHQDRVEVHSINNQLYDLKLSSHFQNKGCTQFRPIIYGLSDSALSEHTWAQTPLIAVVLPCPDPTGAQGVAGTFGFTRDLIFDALYAAKAPVRVALLYLVRGYNFEKAFRGELIQKKLNKSAISSCLPYLHDDIDKIKPDRIVLCGQDVGEAFFHYFKTADYRRKRNLILNIKGEPYRVQVTHAPYMAGVSPPLISCIRDDFKKLFEKPFRVPAGKSVLLNTLPEIINYINFLKGFEGYVAVDTETENLNRKAPNKLGTIQFAHNGETGYVIPFQHSETPLSGDELEIVRGLLADLFKTPSKIKGWIAHNAKFEQMVFKRHLGTYMVSAPVYCTQAMAFLLDETRAERKADIPSTGGIFTLKILARDLLGWEGYDQGILAIREAGTLLDLPLSELASYAGMDAWVTWLLFERVRELARLQDYEEKLMHFTAGYYSNITRLIAHIETNGFKTDLKHLRTVASKRGPLVSLIEELEAKLKNFRSFQQANLIIAKQKAAGISQGIFGKVPWVLDISKPAHKAIVFFDVMGLEPVSFADKSGLPSIDDEFFEAYSEEHEEVALFAKYEESKKMRDAFIVKTLERVDPETGDPDAKIDQCVRSDIHYARIVTGRWAMTNPNLGQIPKSSEGSETEFQARTAVKNSFTVEKGCALIQIDYKVNEVRWAGILAQDPQLAAIFNTAYKMLWDARRAEDKELLKKAEIYEDVHRGTASSTFKVELEKVTKPQRTAAKAITFGILFQSSAQGIGNNAGITLEEAEAYIQLFFSKMVKVANLIDTLKFSAQTRGYVEAPTGRRRRFWAPYLPNSHPRKKQLIARNLRQSVNSPIQGVASDSAMTGAACVLDYIERVGHPLLKIQNVVHDSVISQVPYELIADFILHADPLMVDETQERMTRLGVNFNLPLGVDVEVGVTWGNLTKWEGTRTHAYEIQQAFIEGKFK